MPLSRDLREFIECLNSNEVEYVVVGAFAVSWHGLGCEPNRIDLMTSITGVSFDDAWEDRVTGDLDGLHINFIGRSSLLRNKDATGRAKDRIDAEELRQNAFFLPS